MPNRPRTVHRNHRIPDELYIPAQKKAAIEGISVTDAICGFLSDWTGVPITWEKTGVKKKPHPAEAAAMTKKKETK